MTKIALVTGGAKGLGLAISEELVKNGYKVYAASRNPVKSKNKLIQPIKLDVTSKSECKNVVKKIIKKNKRIDLLVNNAGTSSGDDVQEMFAVNVFGPHYLIKYCNPTQIINITSLNALVATPNASIYSASKHAIEALGIAMSYQKNITNIASGAIYNPNSKKLDFKPIREKYPILKIIFPMITKTDVARKVLEITKMDKPPKRVVLGRDANLAFLFYRLFPNLWFYLTDKMYK